jgi:hypothetical protein
LDPTTVTPEEEEAAFLASYSLYLGATSPTSNVSTVNGPISMAIWQLMGTLGSTAPDPAALPYIQMAQSAYNDGLIAPYLSSFSIWTPSAGVSSQKFITAIRLDTMVLSATPEPGTVVFLGTGVLLMGLSRIRRRR